jgi:hypothetical protein
LSWKSLFIQWVRPIFQRVWPSFKLAAIRRRGCCSLRACHADYASSFLESSTISWSEAMGVRKSWSIRRRGPGRVIPRSCAANLADGICARFEVERTELSIRGSRHPARVVLAYLARSRMVASNTEQAATHGVSRAERSPNLTRRFGAWLATDAGVRDQSGRLEKRLNEPETSYRRVHRKRAAPNGRESPQTEANAEE